MLSVKVYVDNAVSFLNHKNKPSERFMRIFHILCALIVFLGAIIPMSEAWAIADICMGCMALINLPTCMILGKIAIDCLKDYETQRKSGQDPIFKAKSIGFDEEDLDFWD